MAGIKGKSGGARISSGRKKEPEKNKKFAGFKYTESEYNRIIAGLNSYKKENNLNSRNAILELIGGKISE